MCLCLCRSDLCSILTGDSHNRDVNLFSKYFRIHKTDNHFNQHLTRDCTVSRSEKIIKDPSCRKFPNRRKSTLNRRRPSISKRSKVCIGTLYTVFIHKRTKHKFFLKIVKHVRPKFWVTFFQDLERP